MDGFPIYNAYVQRLGRRVTNRDLDDCHGGNFGDGYRYYVNDEYPYTVGCLRGQLRHAVECGSKLPINL